jgi:hypothetical protein
MIARVRVIGFSAGYGAVREILRSPEYFAQVNNALLIRNQQTIAFWNEVWIHGQ